MNEQTALAFDEVTIAFERTLPRGPDFQLTVYGTPETAGSKRAFVIRGKNGGKPRAIVTDDNKKGKGWKAEILQAAGRLMEGKPLLDGPLGVRFTFTVRRPAGHTGKRGLLPSAPAYPAVRPDVLKLARAVEDALSGVVYRDDAQIVVELLEKVYGSPERVDLAIWVAR